jgi:hypothetical protein
MAVHMRLQGAWAREALVADLALVLLLGARRDFGAKLAHHGLRCRWHAVADKRRWAGKRPIEID